MSIQKINAQPSNSQPSINFKGAIKLKDTLEANSFIADFVDDFEDVFVKSKCIKDVTVKFLENNFEKQAMRILKKREIPHLYLNKQRLDESEFDRFVAKEWDGVTAEIDEV